MQIDSFRTIKAPSRGTYREKGSKFLGFAFPCESEEEAKSHLRQLRKEYFDATHHCYAWVLGPDQKNKRTADDGEPAHSAGDPIMVPIRSKGLTNIIIVVVRYFGGVKLGVGGLTSAYRAAADETLRNAIIIEKDVTLGMKLQYNHEAMPEVMRLIKKYDVRVVAQNYTDRYFLEIELRIKNTKEFEMSLQMMAAKDKLIDMQLL